MRETMILILILIATIAKGRDLVLSAPLEPVRSATVYAGLNGHIRDIRVQMEDRVLTGDTLGVIHRPDLELKEATALVRLKKTRAAETRLNQMHKRDSSARTSLKLPASTPKPPTITIYPPVSNAKKTQSLRPKMVL
ncbi:MAG: hypothetical protein OXH16_02970 [Gemmatimonadetes bacterium]|nr:hypothetical protein [Gemmatimonadota bacterium]